MLKLTKFHSVFSYKLIACACQINSDNDAQEKKHVFDS